MTLAEAAEVGLLYRPTAGGEPNVWFTRPKQTAADYVARLEKRRNACTGRQLYMIRRLSTHPDLVLFVRHRRGTDLTSGKYEITDRILLCPDRRLRALKSKPGFARRSST